MKSTPQGRALAVGLALVVIWAAAFSIQKAAYAAMGPGAYLFLRAIVMAVCSVAMLAWYKLPLWPTLAPGEWRAFLGVTVTGSILQVALTTFGIHMSTPFSAAVITACGPVITLVLLLILHGVRMRPPQMLGVVVAMAGVLLFMADKLMQADLRATLGDLMMLASAVTFSLYTIRVTPLARRYGGMAMLCWSTLLATPLMLAGTLAPVLQSSLATITPMIWFAFFWSVLVSAFLGWVAWNWVNAVRGVARTAPLLYLIPPVAGVIGWVFLGEALTTAKLIGGALAMGGVALAQWAAPRA
ncbi:MAG: DMT family transporter [Pseudomonadota bacterium]